MNERTCRHCGWKFRPNVDYPKRCPNHACQKPWPLGLRPDFTDATYSEQPEKRKS